MTPAEPVQLFQKMVRNTPDYFADAFLFVRDGLHAASSALHGEETSAHQQVHQYLREHNLDWAALAARYDAGQLPEHLTALIRSAGGCEKLNRHVTGKQLCLALRDLALQRWGMLARTVLESWGVRSTRDFGRIVFAFIEHGLMQKQPSDCLEDFDRVYDFDDAFPTPSR